MKNLTSIHNKNSQKLGIEENFLILLKNICKKKCRDNIILNGEKLKTFPLRSETKQGCHFLHHFFFQHFAGRPRS